MANPNDTLAPTKPLMAGCQQEPCSRLRELTELIRENKKGKWRLILDYDNYHDGARILDGDGNLLTECYELPPEDMDGDDGVAWQFSKALDHAQSLPENVDSNNCRKDNES